MSDRVSRETRPRASVETHPCASVETRPCVSLSVNRKSKDAYHSAIQSSTVPVAVEKLVVYRIVDIDNAQNDNNHPAHVRFLHFLRLTTLYFKTVL